MHVDTRSSCAFVGISVDLYLSVFVLATPVGYLFYYFFFVDVGLTNGIDDDFVERLFRLGLRLGHYWRDGLCRLFLLLRNSIMWYYLMVAAGAGIFRSPG